MKSWMLISLTGSLMLSLAACTSHGQRIEVSCDDFYGESSLNGTIELNPGEQLELSLCSNPTTGFQWEDPPLVSDPSVIEAQAMHFDEPSIAGNSELVGAPGIQRWTFKGLESGFAKIELTYSQPWEGGDKAAWTYQLSVTVR